MLRERLGKKHLVVEGWQGRVKVVVARRPHERDALNLEHTHTRIFF